MRPNIMSCCRPGHESCLGAGVPRARFNMDGTQGRAAVAVEALLWRYNTS